MKKDKVKPNKTNPNKVKLRIYTRTFAALMAAYLVLMAGFSILTLNQQSTIENSHYYQWAMNINYVAQDILQNNTDNNNQITNIVNLRNECAGKLASLSYSNVVLAIYTSDCDLIYDTYNDWECTYYVKRDHDYTNAYINPKDWFTKEEITELNNYLRSAPNPTKVGDLFRYDINLDGFWLDHGKVIPDKIIVTPMYAKEFDENRAVVKYTSKPEIIFTSNFKNTKYLPHYRNGYIHNQYGSSKIQKKLSDMLFDKDRLKELIDKDYYDSVDRVNLITSRYYCPVPYHLNALYGQEDKDFGAFYTVTCYQTNLLKKCINTLLFVWISCFVLFVIVALILSAENYKIYRKRVELDRFRSESTNALAHDLKTPLSIISGYAQNLIENIHTEKRDYYAGNINDNVNRMDKIIREMLELSRYDTDTNKLIYEDVSLGEVCTKLMDRYSQVCKERQFMVSLEGDAVVRADFSLMERVIDNFFVNATFFTPDAGTIHISIFNNRLEFYNSGSHIPEDMIDEIWQPYKKADDSRSNRKGSGLGLSISGKILDLYRFSYGAKNMDSGVTFWFQW